jgi:hypothetical protein
MNHRVDWQKLRALSRWRLRLATKGSDARRRVRLVVSTDSRELRFPIAGLPLPRPVGDSVGRPIALGAIQFGLDGEVLLLEMHDREWWTRSLSPGSPRRFSDSARCIDGNLDLAHNVFEPTRELLFAYVRVPAPPRTAGAVVVVLPVAIRRGQIGPVRPREHAQKRQQSQHGH